MLPVWFLRRLFVLEVASYSDGRIRRNGNDRYFVRLPGLCDVARAFEFSVTAYGVRLYKFPNANPIANGNAFKGSAFDLLINHFRRRVVVERYDCFTPVAVDPGALNFAENLVAVMVVKQDADIVKAGKIYRAGAMV